MDTLEKQKRQLEQWFGDWSKIEDEVDPLEEVDGVKADASEIRL